jgi:hypothetical protein
MVNIPHNSALQGTLNIKFVSVYYGGALPAFSWRYLMRKESWVPSPNNIASEEIENRLSRLSFDTAASVRSGLSLR